MYHNTDTDTDTDTDKSEELPSTQTKSTAPLLWMNSLRQGPRSGVPFSLVTQTIVGQNAQPEKQDGETEKSLEQTLNITKIVEIPGFPNKTFLDHLKLSLTNAKKARGKHVIMVLGMSGVGKSTLINFLRQKDLKKVTKKLMSGKASEDYTVEVVANDEDIAKVGHTKTSQTLYPEIFDQDKNIVFCDCAGFNDTRGEAIDRIASFATKMIAEQAASIRLVLSISYSFLNQRGSSFRESLSALKNFFPDLLKHPESIILLITQTDLSKEDVISEITEFPKQASENDINMDVFNFILRSRGKYIEICQLFDKDDHIDKKKRKDILSRITKLKPVTQGSVTFHTSMSSQAEQTLIEDFLTISKRGIKLLSEKNHCKKSVVMCKEELSNIDQEIKNENVRLDRIRQKNDELTREIEERRKKIKENENRISYLREKLKRKQEEIDQCNKDIARYTSDEEVLLTEDSYYSSSQTTFLFFDVNIEHYFEFYVSKPITRIEKECEYGYWKYEEGGKGCTYYKVKYKSGSGNTADAKIKIYSELRCYPENIRKAEEREKDRKKLRKEVEEDHEDITKRTKENIVAKREIEEIEPQIQVVDPVLLNLKESERKTVVRRLERLEHSAEQTSEAFKNERQHFDLLIKLSDSLDKKKIIDQEIHDFIRDYTFEKKAENWTDPIETEELMPISRETKSSRGGCTLV